MGHNKPGKQLGYRADLDVGSAVLDILLLIALGSSKEANDLVPLALPALLLLPRLFGDPNVYPQVSCLSRRQVAQVEMAPEHYPVVDEHACHVVRCPWSHGSAS